MAKRAAKYCYFAPLIVPADNCPITLLKWLLSYWGEMSLRIIYMAVVRNILGFQWIKWLGIVFQSGIIVTEARSWDATWDEFEPILSKKVSSGLFINPCLSWLLKATWEVMCNSVYLVV